MGQAGGVVAQLELAARQQAGAGGVAALVLAALAHVEDALVRRLTARPHAEPQLLGAAATAPAPAQQQKKAGSRPSSARSRPSSAAAGARLVPLGAGAAPREVSVNSASAWKGAFGRLVGRDSADTLDGGAAECADPADPGAVLHACAEDMAALWADPVVRELLDERKVRLQEMSGL